MIDVHVHFRDWEQKEKETIKHGYGVAHAAGILHCFDMPNTSPPLTSKKNIIERLKIGQDMVELVDSTAVYRAYAGLTSSVKQIDEVMEAYNEYFPRLVGFKMFAGHSTGNMGILEKDEQRIVYTHLRDLKYSGVVAVHCEKTSLMKENLFQLDKPETHSLARPVIAEVESIKDQIDLVKETNFEGKLHICHISTKEGIELVKKAKGEGLKISCGATAHHALLNDSAYQSLGLLVKMNPPLRCEEDRKAVFSSLLNGDIDWIESDHAPHTLTDKMNGASGIPGFAGTLILIRSLRAAGASEHILNALCGGNANRVFGMKLEITVPSDKKIASVLDEVRNAYSFDAFASL